jgi:uncharacterized protein (DUF58 family)
MMSDVRLLDRQERRTGPAHRQAALELARRLPNLVVAAKEVASSVMHGVHGRKRAGIGETFWQFRPFISGESTTGIDWRRSARDDRIYVREREWEAAHTVYIWMDRSPSMSFVSKLAPQSKVDRALVLGLAAADLLVRGGERVGILGLTRAIATRNIVEVFAETLLADERSNGYAPAELPPGIALDARTQAILIGDFLCDPADLARAMQALTVRGARGHLVMIVDPVEETFPFTGNTEFIDVDSPATLRVGKAEAFRDDYVSRLAAHRDAVLSAARRRGFSVLLHRTDNPASQALLALRTRLEAEPQTAGWR